MKIRTDFVTNSSSSSFIIAKRKDCTRDTILKILQPIKEEVVECLKENRYMMKLPTGLEDVLEKDEEQEIERIGLEYLTEELFEFDFGEARLEIDNWDILARECSNESEQLLDMILYNYSYLIRSNEYFKIA